jgi:hypothetical protein
MLYVFSLALLAKNFLFRGKPLAFWYWYKAILKQPHPHYYVPWQLYSSHTTQNVIQFLMIYCLSLNGLNILVTC